MYFLLSKEKKRKENVKTSIVVKEIISPYRIINVYNKYHLKL